MPPTKIDGVLGQQSRKHADQLVKAALQAGTSSNGFDGVAFFSASHPVGSSTYSNNYTTSALSAAKSLSRLAAAAVPPKTAL